MTTGLACFATSRYAIIARSRPQRLRAALCFLLVALAVALASGCGSAGPPVDSPWSATSNDEVGYFGANVFFVSLVGAKRFEADAKAWDHVLDAAGVAPERRATLSADTHDWEQVKKQLHEDERDTVRGKASVLFVRTLFVAMTAHSSSSGVTEWERPGAPEKIDTAMLKSFASLLHERWKGASVIFFFTTCLSDPALAEGVMPGVRWIRTTDQKETEVVISKSDLEAEVQDLLKSTGADPTEVVPVLTRAVSDAPASTGISPSILRLCLSVHPAVRAKSRGFKNLDELKGLLQGFQGKTAVHFDISNELGRETHAFLLEPGALAEVRIDDAALLKLKEAPAPEGTRYKIATTTQDDLTYDWNCTYKDGDVNCEPHGLGEGAPVKSETQLNELTSAGPSRSVCSAQSLSKARWLFLLVDVSKSMGRWRKQYERLLPLLAAATRHQAIVDSLTDAGGKQAPLPTFHTIMVPLMDTTASPREVKGELYEELMKDFERESKGPGTNVSLAMEGVQEFVTDQVGESLEARSTAGAIVVSDGMFTEISGPTKLPTPLSFAYGMRPLYSGPGDGKISEKHNALLAETLRAITGRPVWSKCIFQATDINPDVRRDLVRWIADAGYIDLAASGPPEAFNVSRRSTWLVHRPRIHQGVRIKVQLDQATVECVDDNFPQPTNAAAKVVCIQPEGSSFTHVVLTTSAPASVTLSASYVSRP